MSRVPLHGVPSTLGSPLEATPALGPHRFVVWVPLVLLPRMGRVGHTEGRLPLHGTLWSLQRVLDSFTSCPHGAPVPPETCVPA